MSRSVVIKVILLILGMMVLVQLVFYNGVQSGNLEKSRQERMRLSRNIEELSVTKQELELYLTKLQQEYTDIVAAVPEEILQGYEDHEVILASFLDYINASQFDKVDARVNLQGARKYVSKPVPLFEYDMNFDFSFERLTDAKKFISLILDQDYYPLVVRNFELRSSGKQDISGILQTSLLIPARPQKQLFGDKVEGN